MVEKVFCRYCGVMLTQSYTPVEYDEFTGVQLPRKPMGKHCANTTCPSKIKELGYTGRLPNTIPCSDNQC